MQAPGILSRLRPFLLVGNDRGSIVTEEQLRNEAARPLLDLLPPLQLAIDHRPEYHRGLNRGHVMWSFVAIVTILSFAAGYLLLAYVIIRLVKKWRDNYKG